jgi:hypothetical protein
VVGSPRPGRVGRNASVGRIDHERRSLLAVDDRVRRSRIEPERVVAADIAGSAGRPVAAHRRRRAIALDRLRRDPAHQRDLTFEFLGLFVTEHGRHVCGTLDWRQRREVIGALEIGMPIGCPRDRRRLRRGL